MFEGLSVKNFFEADHERLDQLYVNYMKFKSEQYSRALDYFFQWKAGLQRHITWEEQVVFPLFLLKTDNERPIRVMRLEHRRILEILDLLSAKIKEGNRRTDTEEYQLLVLLGEHALKEEMVLYPSIEASITEQETAEVFRQLNYAAPSGKRAS